jgi:integration host factor subunit alpha
MKNTVAFTGYFWHPYQYPITGTNTHLQEHDMALTKSNIVAKVQEIGFTKRAAVGAVESLIEIIKQTLEGEEDVLISGFGKFCVKDKRSRRGRNPSTGEDQILPARKVVTFKCSGKLRGRINGT